MSEDRLFVTRQHEFNDVELDRIIEIGDALVHMGKHTPTAEVPGVRFCKLAWMLPNDVTAWLQDRMLLAARKINQASYQFDLDGLFEPMQYTVYTAGSFFDWHVDKRPHTLAPRKLSLTLQLSDPANYDGGFLEARSTNVIWQAPMQRGSITAFPSWVSHRVAPVTRGIRKSLVVWIGGPEFK